MPPASFPAHARQIHLDFHTSPLIEGVADRFEPEQFARTLAGARVNSVTLFAKCHHGHLYFDTDHAARHPGMGEGLLERQIEALRNHGIRCPIYISVQCDEYAAILHPDWRAMDPDGKLTGRPPLADDLYAWRILDMSSPYLDYLEAQTEEILRKFAPVDGLFFDMCWDQPSVSKWAIAGMRNRGLDPQCAADRAQYAGQVSRTYMKRLSELVARYQKDAPIWYNSRSIADARKEKEFLRHLEIEALPTGQWGYGYFPVWARYGKTLGLPMLGMTGRFHKSWADFGGLRTVDSLKYDCALALAHGAGCSVGDQLHPSGWLDPAVYDVIGEVYRHVETCEPWCRGVEPVREIAVLFERPTVANQAEQTYDGLARALGQLRYQFVLIDADNEWESYPLVLVPEPFAMTDHLECRLAEYRQGGGKILRENTGGTPSPFSEIYVRFEDDSGGSQPATDHVFYERGVRLQPRDGDTVCAWIVEPYFQRDWEKFCSHAHTPNRLERSAFAAAVVRDGEGLLALPVFRAYSEHGNIPCRQLAAAVLKKLLPNPALRLKAPSHVEGHVGERGSETILHLLSYIPQKRARRLEMVEEAAAARNVEVDVRVSGAARSVKRVTDGQSLAFVQDGDRVRFLLDWLEGHEVVVIERSDS